MSKVPHGILGLFFLITLAPVANDALAQETGLRPALMKAQARLARTGVETDDLEEDLRLILDMSDQITELGFDRSEVGDAAAAAWLSLRYRRDADIPPINQDDIQLFKKSDAESRRNIFLKTMKAMGKLAVTSVPDGAAIKVGGISWDAPTNTARFVDEGEQRITIVKKGYKPHRGSVTVKRRAETPYHVELEKE